MSRVELVQIDALVTDGGRPVTGLTPASFEIRDNDVVQRVEWVRAEEVSLDVILLLDVSGSVEGAPLEHLRNAAHAALETLRPDDRAALIGFAGRIALMSPLSTDLAAVGQAADRLEARGLTSFHDALFSALLVSGGAPGRRTMLLVYTDGFDTASWLDPAAPAELARHGDAVISLVTLQPGPVLSLRIEEDRQRRNLRNLAEGTGGTLLFADDTEDVRRAFVEAIGEFKNRYLIAYYPQGVERGGWHEIDVRLKGRRGQVQARKGYFAD
jgi:VWFA-related protein